MTPPRSHPRDALVATMRRIYDQRMTTTSGGNLSIRGDDGTIWITPARVDKGSLTSADIVRIAPDGQTEGLHPPSSELPFHREIYRRRPDLRAIIHAHPGALVAFSICHQIPKTDIHALIHTICGRVAPAPYACPGTQTLGTHIATTFASGADCVLLENHGVAIGGRDLGEALRRFETLEFAAQTLIRAAMLGPVQVLPPGSLSEESGPAFAELLPRTASDSGQGLRAELCRFVGRAHRQLRLLSTSGAFSARQSENEFLITPQDRGTQELQAADLVRVHSDLCTAGQSPSRSSRLHAEIYARLPGVGAIIDAQPAHAFAFCITTEPLSTLTIPESYMVLNEVPTLPFRRIVGDASEIANRLSLGKTPALLIANQGAIVIGRTLLEAYDRLEVLETTAEGLLLSRPLCPMVPMTPTAVAELRRTFPLA